MLNGIIDEQFDQLNKICKQGTAVTVLSKLSFIKSLYLVHYHGFDR